MIFSESREAGFRDDALGRGLMRTTYMALTLGRRLLAGAPGWVGSVACLATVLTWTGLTSPGTAQAILPVIDLADPAFMQGSGTTDGIPTLPPLPALPMVPSPEIAGSARPKEGADLLPVRATVERMVARTLIVGFNGLAPDSNALRRFESKLSGVPLGGFVLFGRNLSTQRQIRELTAHLQSRFVGDQFIAIDEEGGAVRRLARISGVEPIAGAAAVGKQGSLAAEQSYGILARALSNLGFNLNFGPVVDLAINPDNAVIARLGRSYGTDPADVAKFAAIFVAAHRAHGISTAAKHFPGHGSTRLDPHSVSVDATRSWSEVELEPFRRLIEIGGPDLVMTSHLKLASKALGLQSPSLATFSPEVIETLRRRLRFSGLVVTDDLTMGAIKLNYSMAEATTRALLAGHDLIILANFGPDPETEIRSVISDVTDRALQNVSVMRAVRSASDRVERFWQDRRVTPYPRDRRPETISEGKADAEVKGMPAGGSARTGPAMTDAARRSLRDIEAALTGRLPGQGGSGSSGLRPSTEVFPRP